VTRHRLEVRVKPRAGLLDPQGAAIHHALDSLGFEGVSEARVGKVIDLTVEAPSQSEAVELARKLLANPVTEDFDVSAERDAEAEEAEV
jgi:phosphoribosylformylglycinamidine synthase PurS subunit